MRTRTPPELDGRRIPLGKRKPRNGFGGRPRMKEPRRGDKVMLAVMVTQEMKTRFVKIAAATGRSQSQEAELRLHQSFFLEDLLKARLISMRMPAGKREDQ